MIRGAATAAIVSARLRKEFRVAVLSAAACASLAYLQRNDDALAQVAGFLVFGTLVGVAIAVLQRGAGRFRELELCEQSAPLYGRELARATALVPCLLVTLAGAAYWIVAAAYGHVHLAQAVLCMVAVYAATIAALCAGVRTGIGRVLYVAIACAVATSAFALASYSVAIAIAACVLAGFIALRQYGEALARYDPV
jgi:hypothetical protein